MTKPPWRAIFEHKFLDRNIRNFDATPGALIVSNPPPLLIRRTDARTHQGLFRFGRTVSYVFDELIEDVIGLDIALLLRVPHVPHSSTSGPAAVIAFPDATLTVDFQFPFVSAAVDGERLRKGTFEFKVGQAGASWSSFQIPHRKFVTLRAAWHNSGQTRLWANSNLVAFNNGVAAGSKFSLPSMSIGSATSNFHLGGIIAKVLRRHDALLSLSGLVDTPIPEVPELKDCAWRIEELLLKRLNAVRQFMSEVSRRTTQKWEAGTGDGGGPFTTAANEIHASALRLAEAWAAAVRAPSPQNSDAVLAKLEGFLVAIDDAVPDLVAELRNRLSTLGAVDTECSNLIEQYRPALPQNLVALEALMAAASALIDTYLQEQFDA